MRKIAAEQPTPRVAWIIKGLGLGGAERIVADLAPLLAGSAVGITVLSTLLTDTLESDLTKAGIEVKYPPRSRLWIPWLLGELSSGNYDIVHTHSPLPAIVVSTVHPLLRRWRQWPTFNVDTAHTDPDSYHPTTRRMTRLTARFKDRVLATSEISRLGVRNEKVVHHGVPVENGSRETQIIDPDDNTPRIVCVAGLRPQKDHATLIKACSLLANQGLEFHLDLIGDGPLRGDLQKRVRSNSLEEHISFLGWATDVRGRISTYDLFVLSTHFEGFPISLVEAIVAGVPSVATDVPGNREALTLQDGQICGTLVRPQDATDLAHAIEKQTMQLDSQSLADLLSRRSEELSITRTVASYLETYRSLLTA